MRGGTYAEKGTSPSNNEKWNLCRTGQMRTGHICPVHCPNYKLDPLANSIRDWNPRHSLSAVWTHFYPSLLPLLFSMHSLLFSLPVEHLAPLASSQLYFHPETIRAARRGQGGRLTTLNFRPRAMTSLNLGHVLISLSSKISRKQTMQYRKSTKEATSGKRYAKEREPNNEDEFIWLHI